MALVRIHQRLQSPDWTQIFKNTTFRRRTGRLIHRICLRLRTFGGYPSLRSLQALRHRLRKASKSLSLSTLKIFFCSMPTESSVKQESWAIAKTNARCAQYMGALKNFESPDQQTATFSEICNGLLFRSILRMCVQNWKFVALPVPEIIGGTEKISAVLGHAHASFSPKF